MKKYTPYILPLIVIAVVFILVYRWYNMRTERMTSSLLDEGVIIENLSEEELAETLNEAGDFKTIELKPVTPAGDDIDAGEGENEGDGDDTGDTTDSADETSSDAQSPQVSDAVIRYDITDDNRVRFSVIGTFPESSESYQVFLRDIDGTVTRHAFTLEDRKGGLVGSAGVSVDVLPVDVIVARGGTDEPGEVVLEGRIDAPAEDAN